MDFRDHDTRLAAYAVVREDRDRILPALWNEVEQPEWTLPCGGVEFDETPAEGAMRELLEESGYEVELLEVLGVDTHAIPAPCALDCPVWSPTAGECTAIMRYVTNRRPLSDGASG